MNPIVYLFETQISALFGGTKGPIIDGIAYALDDNTVFHAYTESPKITPSGNPILCKFTLLSSYIELQDSSKYVNELINNQPTLFVFLVIQDNTLRHKSIFKNSDSEIECSIKFIPEKSDLYSRSKGLLETDAL